MIKSGGILNDRFLEADIVDKISLLLAL